MKLSVDRMPSDCEDIRSPPVSSPFEQSAEEAEPSTTLLIYQALVVLLAESVLRASRTTMVSYCEGRLVVATIRFAGVMLLHGISF